MRAVVAALRNSWFDQIRGQDGGDEESATSCLFSMSKVRPSRFIKTKITILTSPFELINHQLSLFAVG